MNWLDTQTKELLQKVPGEKLAPPKTAEFALVLLRNGQNRQRVVAAIMSINKCSESDAASLASRATPFTVNPDLTEEEALWGQFELICCDAVSIFIRSEVLEENNHSYLGPLFKKVSESSEFRPATVSLTQVPKTESGDKFLEQFVGGPAMAHAFPISLTIPFKKARIMEHWAARVGAEMKLQLSDAGGSTMPNPNGD
jgi:hypothetical protein